MYSPTREFEEEEEEEDVKPPQQVSDDGSGENSSRSGEVSGDFAIWESHTNSKREPDIYRQPLP